MANWRLAGASRMNGLSAAPATASTAVFACSAAAMACEIATGIAIWSVPIAGRANTGQVAGMQRNMGLVPVGAPGETGNAAMTPGVITNAATPGAMTTAAATPGVIITAVTPLGNETIVVIRDGTAAVGRTIGTAADRIAALWSAGYAGPRARRILYLAASGERSAEHAQVETVRQTGQMGRTEAAIGTAEPWNRQFDARQIPYLREQGAFAAAGRQAQGDDGSDRG